MVRTNTTYYVCIRNYLNFPHNSDSLKLLWHKSWKNNIKFLYQAIEEPVKKTPEEKFRKVLIQTIVSWAEESQIETPKLVREMFRLLHHYHWIRAQMLENSFLHFLHSIQMSSGQSSHRLWRENSSERCSGDYRYHYCKIRTRKLENSFLHST